MITFGSLFAGIGGFDLGLERAGMVCKWQVEINEFCLKVLNKHWPKVTKYDDITKLTGKELEYVDVICGGFPCQDVSEAGPRVGISGERSGLWSEYIRLVCEIRPRFVIVENVTGLLDRGMGTVLRDLAQSGFNAEWDVLPASAFGAPHKRERVFIVAYPNGQRLAPFKVFDRSAYQARTKEPGFGKWWHGGVASSNGNEVFKVPDSGILSLVDGVSVAVDEIRSYGNAIVPPVAEWIGRRIMELTL